MVAERRTRLLDALDAELRGLQTYANEQAEHSEAAKAAFSRAQTAFENLKTQAHAKKTAQAVDSLRVHLEQKAAEVQRSIDDAVEAAKAKAASEIAVPHREADGSVTEYVYQKAQPAPASKRRVKDMRRAEVCPRKTLESPADVDAYVEELRAKLLGMLDGGDAVRLV